KAMRWGRLAWPVAVAGIVAISIATPLASASVRDKWFALPQLLGLLPIPVACAAAFWAAWHVLSRPNVLAAGYGWVAFGATVLIFVLAFLGLAYSIYPYVVLERMTIWEAASSTDSLIVTLVGVAITLPAIVVYTIFMYRVFWGKARALSYS
ncbi:MAG: cytochrome d ubiquinol oxidase subunit II, partial [Gammaproteobacteria bacterium]